MNCPHPSVSPGCGVMKLYIAHWLEDRRRVSELGFNQLSDKHGLDSFPPLATVWCLLSSPSPQLLPAPGFTAPGFTASLLQHQMKLQEPSHCSVRILCCAGGHGCQERSTCIQLDWETSAPRRAEGSECWLAVQVAAGIFIWAAPLMLFNELGWVSVPV